MRRIEGLSPEGLSPEGLSEVVTAPPQEAGSGIYDARGRLVLAATEDETNDAELFRADDLSQALREVAGSPYTIRIVSTTSLRDWGVFSVPFSGFATFTWNGAWSPNAGPVGGCFTEWAPHLAKPHIGGALFGLRSVNVGIDGSVRVIGWNGWEQKINGAAGISIPF